MKKIFKKIIISLVLITLLSTIAFSTIACKKGNKPESSSESSGNVQQPEQTEKVLTDTRHRSEVKGIHQYNVTDSQVKLVENGKSDYVIVIPQSTDDNVLTGATTLANYMFEATGIKFPVKTDTSLNSTDEKIISIGKTVPFTNSGITVGNVNLGTDGYIIQTKGDDVFMYGDSYGCLYSVYEFLTWQFGFDMYSVGVYSLERNVKDMNLKNFDIVDVPDIQKREGGATNLGQDHAFRQTGIASSFVGRFGDGTAQIQPYHNWLSYIPIGTYFDSHPEWFDPGKTQLCLTRDYDGLLAEVTKRCIEEILKDPGKYSITFTQMDGGGWCSHCKQAYLEYVDGKDGEQEGNDIVNVNASAEEKEWHCLNSLKFTSDLAKNIKEWAKTYDPDHEYTVYMFCYGMIGNPPVKEDKEGNPILDENGNYLPADLGFEVADNLGVIFCYTYDLYYDGDYNIDTGKAYDALNRWKTVTDKYMIWNYSTHFQNYLCPFNYLQVIQEDYQLAASSGARILFDQGQFNVPANTDWGTLKSYVRSKLAWNVNADVSKYIDKFFDGYFLDAAPMMKEIYLDYVTYHSYLGAEIGVGLKRNHQDTQLTEKNYPYATVRAYLDKFKRAYESIAHLKINDPELYQQLYDRISLEELSYRYIEIHLYPHKYEYNQLRQMKEDLISECKRLRVTQFSETAGIDSMV